MPRYIDAEKAEKIMHCMDMQDLYLPVHFKEMVLDATQTEDVEPVVHAHWEWLEPNNLTRECFCGTCSACKVRSIYIVNNMICPNCGARMDEEKHDAQNAEIKWILVEEYLAEAYTETENGDES